MAQASQTQLNEFVKVVDDFMRNYARLISPETRTQVYASGNVAMISDYESAVSKGGALKATILATTGAWNAAKSFYSSATETTSIAINDAIDWVKNLFGAGPDTTGLGALQIPAAAWVAGIVASAYLMNGLITKIFVSIEASRIQRDNPGISRTQALQRAKSSVPSLLGGVNTPLLIGGGLLLAYFFFGDKLKGKK